MLDEHIAQENLGLFPVIDLWGFHLPSYTLFMVLAFASAWVCFKLTAKTKDPSAEASKEYRSIRALIIVFALLGGIIGAKLPVILYNYKVLFHYPENLSLLLSGRTIVGGLIGGYLAVFLLKKKLRIRVRTGNDIAAPAALGMAVGRIGCLLGGCCYGIESPAFLGINLGDGIYRYPTQIYEIIFDAGLCVLFLYLRRTRELEPGILFRYLLNAYLTFRFFMEFIRVTDRVVWGISYYQVICVACLVFINRRLLSDIFRRTARLLQKSKALEERKIL